MDIPYHLTLKHHVFQDVEAGHRTLTIAAHDLGLSYRQTLRWWRRYQRASGLLLAFARPVGSRGGWNRTMNTITQAIIDQKKTHPHRSVPHIAEMVSEEHGLVSTATVWRILTQADLLAQPEQSPRVFTRFEASACGERWQMDTTSGQWLPGYRPISLIAVLDDYSRLLVGWQWVDADSAWNNMKVLRAAISTHGLPQTLYTDNASMFKTIRHNRSVYQTHRQAGYETEIQRAMRELGVVMFSHRPYEPQSKGKVERFFRFMQERFVREHTARTLTELNDQFRRWARWYNTQHINRTTGQRPQDRTTPTVLGPVPEKRRLDSAFCFKTTRQVDKCNTISFEGEWYTIPGAVSFFRQTVELETTPFAIRLYHDGHLLTRIDRENP